MNRHKIIVWWLIFSLLCTNALANVTSPKNNQKTKGYKFTLTIKGTTDTIMYLGNYYAGKTYASDTARINKRGQFIFENKDRVLLPGMYFFTAPSGDYVEFIVHNEAPYFTFETSQQNWTNNMVVKGSKENEVYFNYQRSNQRLYDMMDSAQQAKQSDEEFNAFRHSMSGKFDELKLELIDKYPDCLIAIMINATRDPIIPTVDSTGAPISERDRYFYYIDHYFDHMRLDDDAMVRTPDAIFHRRVMNYFDNYLKGADANTISHYADKLIEQARPSAENFKYLVHTLTEKYLQSNIMGYDAVYVHLVQRYYASGDAVWSSPSVIDEQVTRANTWERILIGKEAPELIMRDDNGQLHSLHQQPGDFKLLVFWSPSCGHCKTMIPALYNKYNELKDKYNISAYAVLSEPDEATRPKWRKFIKEHQLDWLNIDGGEANIDWHEVYDVITTPQVFLLDKNNKIVAKRLNAETFETVITAIGTPR